MNNGSAGVAQLTHHHEDRTPGRLPGRFADTNPSAWVIAALCTAVATALRAALTPVIHYRSPFTSFILASLIAAWYGGAWPGIASAVAGLAVGAIFFVTSHGSLPLFFRFEWDGILSYLVVTGTAVALIEALRKARRRTESANQLAESRAQQLGTRLAEIRDAEARIRELAAIVQSAQDAIFSETLDGMIRSWNPAAERLYGYAAAEIAGKSATLLVPPDRQDEQNKTFARIRYGEVVGDIETVGLAKDGRRLDLLVSMSPVLSASGAIVGGSTIARDISERKEAAAKIFRLNAELEGRVRERTAALEAVNRDLEAFNYSVSHDLRAPLRSISGFSNAVLEDYADKLDERGVTYLKHAAKASQRMALLIEDLMNLSRASRAELHCQKVDLSAMAAAIMADLQAGDPGRSVEVQIAPNQVAQGDPGLLRIALENLLNNAWKFTSQAPHPKIEFASRVENGMTTYFVRDNGAGFDVAQAHRLFDPFQRQHSYQQFPGSGIGLATVKRILTRLGGNIHADARVNGGATFYFTLPSCASQTGNRS